MKIDAIKRVGLTDIKVNLNIFELQALATKADAVHMDAFGNVPSKLTGEERNAVKDLVTFIRKITADTPSVQQVDHELFEQKAQPEVNNIAGS